MKESFLDRSFVSFGEFHQAVGEDPLTWLPRTAGKLRTLWLKWTYSFASFGRGSWAHYSFHVERSIARYICIGEDVGFGRDARLDVSLAPSTNSPAIILEQGSGLQRRCVISARNRIHVMRNVIFGPSVLVVDHNCEIEKGTEPAGRTQEAGGGTIRIEEECWIGFGASIICKQGELVIGRHCVVAANSVVRSSIPPYSVVMGDPARVVKQYDPSKGKWVLGCARPTSAVDRQNPPHNASSLS